MNLIENSSHREGKALSRGEACAVIAATLFGLILESCSPAKASIPTDEPTSSLPPTQTPTLEPSFADSFPTPAVRETLPLETPPEYILGKKTQLNLAQKFTLTVPLDTARSLGRGAELSFHADIPLPQFGSSWNKKDIELFNANGWDNRDGNAFLLAPTDNPHHFILTAHSGNPSSPASLVIHSGKLAASGEISQAYGQSFKFKFDDHVETIDGELVDVHNISSDQFLDPSNWTEPDSNLFRAELSQLGFNNSYLFESADTYYLTLDGCQYTNPGQPNLKEVAEGAGVNQTLMTFKFVLP